MTIKVKCFGVIAERLGFSEQVLKITETDDLKCFFEKMYPQLINETYQISVNKKICNHLKESTKNIEIALLPPFAGG